MDQRISLITLDSADLQRAMEFYERVVWLAVGIKPARRFLGGYSGYFSGQDGLRIRVQTLLDDPS